MIVKDINTEASYLFELFEHGEWAEVPDEQIQIFLKGNNIGISQDGSYVSDADGMKLVAAVLNMESSVEWLTYQLRQAALATENPLLVTCVTKEIADAGMNAQGIGEEHKMLDLIRQLQAIAVKYRLPLPPYPKTGRPVGD
jgi:hypothetical protein